MKRAAALLIFAIAATLLSPIGAERAMAADGEVYINPSSPRVATFKPGDGVEEYRAVITIMGCTAKSQIADLKSSNKDMPVEARSGYLVVRYGDRKGKATITCTVKGVPLSTTFTVKKYENPLNGFSIGKKRCEALYDKTDSATIKKTFRGKALSLKAKKGWVIRSVVVYNGLTAQTQTWRNLNAATFSKKVTLTSAYGSVSVTCYQEKTGIQETLQLYRRAY